MKTTNTFILFLLLTMSFNVFGQTKILDRNVIEGLEKIPKEGIYIHSNNNLFLSGEYLYYTVYCINRMTKSLSGLSKIAYVELIDQDLGIVFKHKIWLEDGMGSGDFFIPVTLPSGRYKLVGYTHWMKNGELNSIFTSDLLIVNPYKADQSGMVDATIDNDSINPAPYSGTKAVYGTHSANDVTISLNAASYERRSKVDLIIEEDGFLSDGGNYSISVRKKNFMELPVKSLLIDQDGHNSEPFHNLTDEVFLPELRGELIKGKVVPKKENIKVENIDLSISIPGENSYFMIARTDGSGRFFTNISMPYQKEELVFQTLTGNADNYTILLDVTESLSFEYEFDPMPAALIPSQKATILERSIGNQIQNAYFEFRPDSLEAIDSQKLFKSKAPTIYALDDYTRFKTLEETVVEILKDVLVKRVNENKRQVMVQGYDFDTDTGIAPLVLLDGVMVTNTSDFLSYDLSGIKTISVYRNHFVIGSKVFQGALLLESNDNNAFLSITGITVKNTPSKVMVPKKYYNQRYGGPEGEIGQNTMPDYRHQLYWMPNFKSKTEQSNIDFFTSDVSGEFEVHLEGVSSKGDFISLKKSFVVN